ncbi:MAG: GatB/YqeY domain-containing protein [Woeseiaceae bacterium]|nr:GatB/YqeY domain-containing protein [Woeseiaceae bacterium]
MAMSLKGQITEDMKSAMKAGEKDRLKVVRLMLAAIKQIEVDTREDLDEAAVLTVLTKMVKQRRDSVEQFEQGNREDLAAIERAEIVILDTYLPEQLSADELAVMIDKVIQATGASGIRDMGKVMGQIKVKASGRADMGAVSALIKERLNAD